ncbi:MAG: transposase, partial [Elusimicrobia bacterium]|nr:transposase [Elusimicrobiota bacterium]
QMEFKELRQRYWGKHFWVRGYFCATTGVVTEEQIRDYIEKHTKEDDENFTIGKS